MLVIVSVAFHVVVRLFQERMAVFTLQAHWFEVPQALMLPVAGQPGAVT